MFNAFFNAVEDGEISISDLAKASGLLSIGFIWLFHGSSLVMDSNEATTDGLVMASASAVFLYYGYDMTKRGFGYGHDNRNHVD